MKKAIDIQHYKTEGSSWQMLHALAMFCLQLWKHIFYVTGLSCFSDSQYWARESIGVASMEIVSKWRRSAKEKHSFEGRIRNPNRSLLGDFLELYSSSSKFFKL